MEEILKQILGELQKVNNRLDRLEKGQEELKLRMERLEVRQERLEKGQEELQLRQERLEKGQEELQLRQERLEKGQEELQLRQERLEKGQEELQLRQERLEKGQEELKFGQDQLKDNLINGLGPYFEQVEKHIDAKTSELKDILEDQQRVIDTLSARSIKHESEIKDFKRILKNQ